MRRKASDPRPAARAGFTLLELLLVAVLVPVVSLAVYSNFSSGVRLWRALNQDVPEEDVAIFAHKASADLANASRLAHVPFEGGPDALTFAAPVIADEALGGQLALGEVSYRFDEGQRTLFRGDRNLSQLHKGEPGRRSAVLRGVTRFAVSYLVRDPNGEGYVWAKAFNAGENARLPFAVRFDVAREAASGRSELSRTFAVGAGG